MRAPTGHRLALFVWLAGLAAAGWLALFQTPMVTEITRLLPDAGGARQRLAQIQETPAARLILIGLEGGSSAERARVSRGLAARLAAGGRFTRVANGERAAAIGEIRPLFEHRYLLSPAVTGERFTEAGLAEALKARLADLRSPLSPLQKDLLPADPTGETMAIFEAWRQHLAEPAHRDGVWSSPDGARALLLAESPAAGFDPQRQGPLVDAIHAAFAEAAAGTPVRLLVSGPGALASLSERTIRSDATRLGTASLAAILVILAVAYRSPRVILLTPLPLLSAVAAGTAAVGLVFGGIHGITLGFGATLLGVSVDYPVHLFSHRRAGETPAATIGRIWPTLRLCALTTSIGYAAMLSGSFEGLAQLAVFSTAGLLTAALVTRFVLPGLMRPDWVALPEPGGGAGPAAGRLGRAAMRLRAGSPRHALLAGLALLLAGLAVLALQPPRWETDVAAINPLPAAVLAVDARLRADLGAPEAGQMVFIDAADREEALRLSEAVAAGLAAAVARGALAGFDAPSLYLPSLATQQRRQAALPDAETLRERLAAAVAGLPFRAASFAPFVAAVAAARQAPPITLEALAATPIGIKLGQLLLARPDGGWTALVLLAGVKDPAAVAAAVAPLAASGVAFVDFRGEANRTLEAFRETSLLRLAAGALLLTLVVAAGVRDLRRLAAVLLPMAAAVTLDLALLALEGERLTPFHLVSLLLVVGIGIDYGLFFSAGAAAEGAAAGEANRTLHALLTCSSSTLAGFSVLCFSSLPALNAIGQTVTLGVAAAFILALLIARPPARRPPPQPAGRRLASGQSRALP